MGRLLTATVAVHSRKPASIGGVSGPSGTHLDNGGGIVADAPNVWPLPHRGTAYPVTTEPPPPPLKQHKRTSSDRGRVLDLLWAAGDRPPSPHPTARGSSVPSGGAPGGHISSSHHPGRSGTLCRSAPTRATAPTRSLPPSRPSISPTPRSPPSSLFPTPLVAPSLFLHPRPPPHPVASSARACDPPPFPPAPPPLPPQWRPA